MKITQFVYTTDRGLDNAGCQLGGWKQEAHVILKYAVCSCNRKLQMPHAGSGAWREPSAPHVPSTYRRIK